MKKQQQQLLSDDEGFVASPSAQGHLPGSGWAEQDGPVVAHSTAIRPTDLDLTAGTSRAAPSRGKQRCVPRMLL